MMKPELQNWNKSGKTLHQKTLKMFIPKNFHIIIYLKLWYEHRYVRGGWFRFMILFYNIILWWNLWWHITINFCDLNLCDDGWWWNDVGWWGMKWCGVIWYCDEMIWNVVKMKCGKWWNDGGGWYELRCVCV